MKCMSALELNRNIQVNLPRVLPRIDRAGSEQVVHWTLSFARSGIDLETLREDAIIEMRVGFVGLTLRICCRDLPSPATELLPLPRDWISVQLARHQHTFGWFKQSGKSHSAPQGHVSSKGLLLMNVERNSEYCLTFSVVPYRIT